VIIEYITKRSDVPLESTFKTSPLTEKSLKQSLAQLLPAVF